MAGSIEFTPPYQDGWQDNEEGATPITADILNNNYDAFLLLLNAWIENTETSLVAIPDSLTDLSGDVQISSPSNGQVLKFNGTKWVNAAESGGGSNVSWNQILQSGTQIASITINGSSYTVYAPTPITNLNGLSDVTLLSPSNGQVLQFNSNTSKWENKSISVGDSVEFTQVLSSGVKIGTITIDGTGYDIYAPQGGGGSYEPNGVTYTVVNNATDDTQSGQAARSIVVNKFEDNVQTDTGSLSYATVVTTGPNNFTVGNVKSTYTLVSGTAYWVLTVVSGHIQYNGTLYETGDEILRTPVSGSSVITLTDIEEMEESHSTVVWTQTQQSGTKIAEISIDGVSQNVYIPTPPANTSDLNNDSNFVADASYVHTDNNYTSTEKTKLSGLVAVEANPSGTASTDLTKIAINGTNYNIPSGGGGGTTVIANPSGTPTDELNSIQIGNDIYEIPSGGGGTAEWTDVVGTLEAGDTEIVLTSSKIKTTSAVFPWTNKFGVAPTNMVIANGSVTLTFPVQSTDLGVMVRVTEVGGTPEPTPIDTTNTSKYNESSMNVASSSSQMASVWNGGNAIGLTFYLTNPIDVTNLSKLYYELQTSSCYGGGSQAQQERWNVQIGLMATAPSDILNGTYSELNFVAGDDFSNSNTNYGTQEIDVSSLSGTYYLVINAHGWNAIISNLREE